VGREPFSSSPPSSPQSSSHLNASNPKPAQQIVVDAAVRQLTHEPTKETRHRKRPLANVLAEWELRVGDHRIFYDIDPASLEVKIKAFGIKRHSRLMIQGQEFKL
jgi:mRNA-degrading endonuclease RelE of RelBE toxin-antitoxin system